MIVEMVDHPDPQHGRAPLWVDLEALSARYRALAGDSADSLG
jgi:hypothetical protein